MDHEQTRNLYTIIALATSVATLVSVGTLSIYKIDRSLSQTEILKEKTAYIQSQITSKQGIDKYQTDEIRELKRDLRSVERSVLENKIGG